MKYSKAGYTKKVKSYPMWVLKSAVKDGGIFGQKGKTKPKFYKATATELKYLKMELKKRRK